MTPTLQAGDTVLVQKRWFFCSYHIGDIIVLSDPRNGRLLLKRVQKMQREYLYVIGDNKRESTDSRNFGWIERKNTIGKVLTS